jgi:hypothetical protein
MTQFIQNISVAAANDVEITLQSLVPLDGTIWWRVYEEMAGIPLLDLPSGTPVPLIEKRSDMAEIVVGSPPTSCAVKILAADTQQLLRNYYHEATLVDDEAGGITTFNEGILTVTQTMGAP